MKRLATLTALLGFAAAAHAAPETYVIDASQTDTRFSYRYLGMADQTHRFEKISGKIVVDRLAGTAAAEVAIDAASLHAGDTLFNERIHTADFFDSARYPTITFKSSAMTFDRDAATLTGELTIKGVTRPVTLAISRFECGADVMLRTESCGAQASVTIRRSDFNMPKYRFLVSDDVRLNLAIRAVRETARLQVASRDSLR